ncbi:MAG TPA: translational GTPase TypA [Chloroflexota bacterium]|nr:translational GTPase TypA [Chloroflexota bacterium]
MTASPSITAPAAGPVSPDAGRLKAREDIRNIAVIAHVDHGKTTLVDGLLKQSKVFRDADAAGELIMDSNQLERERGITVFAKNAAIVVPSPDGPVKVNLIDTPGHADFSSEVERTLSMADGCLLLVDAAEGPLPQTRFVLGLALQLGLRPLVVVNKIDRKDARAGEVVEEIADLFLELATDAEQLHYPVIYAVAREGRAGWEPEIDKLAPDLSPLFKAILEHVPAPRVDADAPAQLLVSALDYDAHLGRIAIGRIVRGTLVRGQSVRCITAAGASAPLKLVELYHFQGLGRVLIDRVAAGDVAALSGMPSVSIGDTIADADTPEALPRLEITEPTVQLTISPNTGPFAGQDGKAITSRQLKERLDRELETNVGLRVRSTTGNVGQGEGFVVAGRGELHLAILLETLRREGLELAASRPEVILKRDESGKLLEPIEEVVITVPQDHVGTVAELVGPRQAIMEHMYPDEGRGARLVYRAPTRGLIGLRGALMTATRGTATVNSRFLEYASMGGPIPRQRNGAVVATDGGQTTSYAIAGVQERARMFVGPGTPVYEGMVVGLNSRETDMPVNIVKEKKQTNIRSSTADIAVRLEPPFIPSLDQFLEMIAEDELLELTPKNLRLRKRHLTSQEREKAAKRQQSA